jgi:hypothetical protein
MGRRAAFLARFIGSPTAPMVITLNIALTGKALDKKWKQWLNCLMYLLVKRTNYISKREDFIK